MLDIFVLEEDYFQQARLEDAIHKSITNIYFKNWEG